MGNNRPLPPPSQTVAIVEYYRPDDRRVDNKVLFTLNKVYSDTQLISKLSVRNGGFLRQIIHANGNALTNFLGAFGKSSLSSFKFSRRDHG